MSGAWFGRTNGSKFINGARYNHVEISPIPIGSLIDTCDPVLGICMIVNSYKVRSYKNDKNANSKFVKATEMFPNFENSKRIPNSEDWDYEYSCPLMKKIISVQQETLIHLFKLSSIKILNYNDVFKEQTQLNNGDLVSFDNKIMTVKNSFPIKKLELIKNDKKHFFELYFYNKTSIGMKQGIIGSRDNYLEKEKEFDTPEEAMSQFHKTVRDKLSAGYSDVSDGRRSYAFNSLLDGRNFCAIFKDIEELKFHPELFPTKIEIIPSKENV